MLDTFFSRICFENRLFVIFTNLIVKLEHNCHEKNVIALIVLAVVIGIMAVTVPSPENIVVY